MIKLKSLISESVLYEDDKEEFLKHHYTGYIQPDAYKKYEKEGGLAWLGNKSKWPMLLDTETHGPYEVEFRQKREKLQYAKRKPDDEYEHVRDENGNVIYLSPEEMKAENLPEYDTTIVAFVNDKPIGFVSDEFGAVGVWVEASYQKIGIGTSLLEKHMEQRPNMKSGKGKIGQMTPAGRQMVSKYYDKMSAKHGKDWFQKLRSVNV